jgi:hypothetical protein
MRAVLKLECIGDDGDQAMRGYTALVRRIAPHSPDAEKAHSRQPWVARITGRDARYGFARKFQEGQKDYSQANSVGSRGVYLYFALSDGIYEVKENTSWKHTQSYFIRVTGSAYETITKEQVEECLKTLSE